MRDANAWPTPRRVGAVIGLLFVILSIAILAVTDRSLSSIVAALVVGLLGVDALVAAYRDTRSILSRIGPLP